MAKRLYHIRKSDGRVIEFNGGQWNECTGINSAVAKFGNARDTKGSFGRNVFTYKGNLYIGEGQWGTADIVPDLYKIYQLNLINVLDPTSYTATLKTTLNFGLYNSFTRHYGPPVIYKGLAWFFGLVDTYRADSGSSPGSKLGSLHIFTFDGTSYTNRSQNVKNINGTGNIFSSGMQNTKNFPTEYYGGIAIPYKNKLVYATGCAYPNTENNQVGDYGATQVFSERLLSLTPTEIGAMNGFAYFDTQPTNYLTPIVSPRLPGISAVDNFLNPTNIASIRSDLSSGILTIATLDDKLYGLFVDGKLKEISETGIKTVKFDIKDNNPDREFYATVPASTLASLSRTAISGQGTLHIADIPINSNPTQNYSIYVTPYSAFDLNNRIEVLTGPLSGNIYETIGKAYGDVASSTFNRTYHLFVTKNGLPTTDFIHNCNIKVTRGIPMHSIMGRSPIFGYGVNEFITQSNSPYDTGSGCAATTVSVSGNMYILLSGRELDDTHRLGAYCPPTQIIKYNGVSAPTYFTLTYGTRNLDAAGIDTYLDPTNNIWHILYMSRNTRTIYHIAWDCNTDTQLTYGTVYQVPAIADPNDPREDYFYYRNGLGFGTLHGFTPGEKTPTISSMTYDVSGRTSTINYNLFSNDALPTNIEIQYNVGLGFEPATRKGMLGEGLINLTTAAPSAGAPHVYVHDVAADVSISYTGNIQYEITCLD